MTGLTTDELVVGCANCALGQIHRLFGTQQQKTNFENSTDHENLLVGDDAQVFLAKAVRCRVEQFSTSTHTHTDVAARPRTKRRRNLFTSFLDTCFQQEMFQLATGCDLHFTSSTCLDEKSSVYLHGFDGV